MDYKIIPAENSKTTNWSGGTTTELYIYPESANYQKRNFDFRLSTATVEIAKSDFTPLTDISRTLMVLEGNMTLNHKGHHEKELGKFDVDRFQGGWQTSSTGKCIDLNLMTMGDTHGDLDSIILEENETIKHSFENKWNMLVIYIYSGKVNIKLNHKDCLLGKGDVLVIKEFDFNSLLLNGIEKGELILAKIIT